MEASALARREDLWRRAKAGDEEARGALALAAREVASRELPRRGVRPAELEDLTQEAVRSTLAFLSRSAEEPRDLGAFLKFRALGVLSDHRKRMRSSLPTVDPDAALEPEARAPGPDRAFALTQTARALRECEQALPPDHGTVVALRYRSQLTTEAIAARLGVHRNTVNVRVFRALAALRECMRRKGFEPGDGP